MPNEPTPATPDELALYQLRQIASDAQELVDSAEVTLAATIRAGQMTEGLEPDDEAGRSFLQQRVIEAEEMVRILRRERDRAEAELLLWQVDHKREASTDA